MTQTEETITPAEEETTTEENQETPTIEELAPEVTPEPEKTEDKQETVPLSVFLEVKDEIKLLRKKLDEPGTPSKPNDVDLDRIAEKYDVDPDFVSELFEAVKANTVKEVEGKYTPVLEAQEAERQAKKFDEAFNKHYEKALEDMPGYAELNIDREAIKAMSLTPQYRKKTIPEILESLYGNVVPGKATTENARSGAENVSDVIDFATMTDEQRMKVINDPTLAPKYYSWLDANGK